MRAAGRCAHRSWCRCSVLCCSGADVHGVARIDPVHVRIEGLAALIGLSAGWVAGPDGWTGALFGWSLGAGGAGCVGAVVARSADPMAGGYRADDRGAGVRAVLQRPDAWRIGRVRAALDHCGGLSALAWARGAGRGDPKLLGAIGLWLGWRMLPAVLLVACLIGWDMSRSVMCSGGAWRRTIWYRWACCSRWRLIRHGC